MKEQLRNVFRRSIGLIVLFMFVRTAVAVEFMPLSKAVIKALKTKNAKQTKNGKGFYTKKRYAQIEKGLYPPNCTHTWVLYFDKKCKNLGINVVEMSCPHAHPTNKASFLDQFKGKGPASVKKLEEEIVHVAKATGSSDLTREAFVKSVKACKKHFKKKKKKKKKKK